MQQDATSEAPDSVAHEYHQRHRGKLALSYEVIATLAILSLPFALVALHVKAYQTFSPIDERQHVDYLYRISRGDLLRMGERIGQETLRDEACRGLDWNLFTPPPCHPNRPYDPDLYPDLGYNSAHIHPPTYYFLTNVVAGTYRATGIARNFVSSARLSGGLWLALALVLFWYAAHELRIPRLRRAAAMALLATTPTILHASSTVNPDSLSLFAGSAVLLTTLVWERKRGYTILLLLMSAVFAVGVKFTNMLVVGASAVYLVLRWWLASRRGRTNHGGGREYLLATAALTIAGVGTALGWMVAHDMLILAPVNPQLEQFQVESLSADAVVTQMMALVTPLREPWLPHFLNNAAIKAIVQLLNLLLLAIVFGALVYRTPLRAATVAAFSGAVVVLVSGMALTLANYYWNSRAYVAIPPRYGISVLPFLFVALASALRHRGVLWTTAILAISSVVALVIGLLSVL